MLKYLKVEGPKRVKQLPRVIIDIAERDTVHCEPVERYHTVRRVDDGGLQTGGLASESGPSRT